MTNCSAIRRIGRPRIDGERRVNFPLSLPCGLADRLDKAAAKAGKTRSDFSREILEAAIAPAPKSRS
nr:MAG TPA: Alginate and motility regulator [Caudoviricetes sp.]